MTETTGDERIAALEKRISELEVRPPMVIVKYKSRELEEFAEKIRCAIRDRTGLPILC